MTQFLSKGNYTVRAVSLVSPAGRLVGDFRWRWMARLAIRFHRELCYAIQSRAATCT